MSYWGNYWVYYIINPCRGIACGATQGVDATDADDALSKAKPMLDRSWGVGNWKLEKIVKAPS